ncbi:hypothetical protein Bca52824_015669 [Brassica carinata]|uniref:GOST seven transmembrane domain-containing protein n=1 Tax=Brassica carinata TaxID=52824 RepID=A0A8X7W303_BRACI|nr:hypothetical protein Bca52824_015669 [Brassica carinata]
MALWYFDYAEFNETGVRPTVITIWAVTFGSIKRTCARVIILMVSMGVRCCENYTWRVYIKVAHCYVQETSDEKVVGLVGCIQKVHKCFGCSQFGFRCFTSSLRIFTTSLGKTLGSSPFGNYSSSRFYLFYVPLDSIPELD